MFAWYSVYALGMRHTRHVLKHLTKCLLMNELTSSDSKLVAMKAAMSEGCPTFPMNVYG
jgi:hypothetical protein